MALYWRRSRGFCYWLEDLLISVRRGKEFSPWHFQTFFEILLALSLEAKIRSVSVTILEFYNVWRLRNNVSFFRSGSCTSTILHGRAVCWYSFMQRENRPVTIIWRPQPQNIHYLLVVGYHATPNLPLTICSFSQKHPMICVPCTCSCCHSWTKRKRFLFRTFMLYLFLFF